MTAAGARRHWLIWVGVVPIAIWALVRTLGLEGDTVLVPLLAFTPFAAIAAFLVAGVALALRNWAAAAVAGLATFALAVAVLPRAIGDETVDPTGRETLDLLSANIHRGTGDPRALVALVDRFDVDLLAVQELTPGAARKLAAAGLERRLPQRVLYLGQPKLPGLGIYSRLPLRPLGRATTTPSAPWSGPRMARCGWPTSTRTRPNPGTPASGGARSRRCPAPAPALPGS